MKRKLVAVSLFGLLIIGVTAAVLIAGRVGTYLSGFIAPTNGPSGGSVSAPEGEPSYESKAGPVTEAVDRSIYKDEVFEVAYPKWSKINSISSSKNVLRAVGYGGCNLVLSSTKIPDGISFKQYADLASDSQIADLGAKVMIRNIGDDTAHVKVESGFGGFSIVTDSYSFLAGGSSYGLSLMGEKTMFDKTCGPYVEDIIKSIKIGGEGVTVL